MLSCVSYELEMEMEMQMQMEMQMEIPRDGLVKGMEAMSNEP